jgi:hypothetical protein
MDVDADAPVVMPGMGLPVPESFVNTCISRAGRTLDGASSVRDRLRVATTRALFRIGDLAAANLAVAMNMGLVSGQESLLPVTAATLGTATASGSGSGTATGSAGTDSEAATWVDTSGCVVAALTPVAAAMFSLQAEATTASAQLRLCKTVARVLLTVWHTQRAAASNRVAANLAATNARAAMTHVLHG